MNPFCFLVKIRNLFLVPSTINWDDINFEKPFWRISAYSHSKLANILFTNELARRLKGLILSNKNLSSLYIFISGTNITANSLHPGRSNSI
jgi:NAD(P)-dependent dehydrogenase (short-subunit alcohol dehydrogenase family)